MPNVNPIFKAANSSGIQPLYLQYLPRSSGDVFTGEQQSVRGGGRTATIWSGAISPNLGNGVPGGIGNAGGHVLIFSGAGRLNSIVPITQLASGNPVYFYDSSILSSGPSLLTVSPYKIIGFIPPTWPGGYPAVPSGVGIAQPPAFNIGQPINVDMPFQSGLCVLPSSGCVGFSISYTPEVSAAFPTN